MHDDLNNELAKFKKALNCGPVLFTIITTLLCIVAAIVCSILFALTMILLTIFVSIMLMSLPFVVLYQCIETRCNFTSEDDQYGNN